MEQNCLLCANCGCDNDYELGQYNNYYCEKRELDNDNRFPYVHTNCKYYKNDTDLTSLCNKDISHELWNTITWAISDY